jgi:hypothetical protein
MPIIEKKAKPKGKAKPMKGMKPDPLRAYDELHEKVVEATRRKWLKPKAGKKAKAEILTEAEANKRVKAAEKLLTAAGFKRVGKTGTWYDGTTFASVTATSTEPVKGSWVVVAYVTRSHLAVADLRFAFGFSKKAPGMGAI